MKFSPFISAIVLTVSPALAQVEYVDPNIGNVGVLLVPTRPTAPLPLHLTFNHGQKPVPCPA